MRHVAHSDVLCFVVDGVEGFVRLQAEGGDGEEDEEQRAKRHILQRETDRGGRDVLKMCKHLVFFTLSDTTGNWHTCAPTFF